MMSFSSRAFCYLLKTEVAKTELSALSTDLERTSFVSGKSGVLDRIAKDLGYVDHMEFLRVDHNWCYNMPEGGGWRIDVYIEHENNIKSAKEEVLKLIHLGPGNKVLITYAPEDRFEHHREEFGELIASLYGIPPMQSLTLVICDLGNEKGTLWVGYEFDGSGKNIRVWPPDDKKLGSLQAVGQLGAPDHLIGDKGLIRN